MKKVNMLLTNLKIRRLTPNMAIGALSQLGRGPPNSRITNFALLVDMAAWASNLIHSPRRYRGGIGVAFGNLIAQVRTCYYC